MVRSTRSRPAAAVAADKAAAAFAADLTTAAAGDAAVCSCMVFDVWAYKIGIFCTPTTRRNLSLVCRFMCEAMRSSWREWLVQARTDLEAYDRMAPYAFMQSSVTKRVDEIIDEVGALTGCVGAYHRRVFRTFYSAFYSPMRPSVAISLLMTVLADLDLAGMWDVIDDILEADVGLTGWFYENQQKRVPWCGYWVCCVNHPRLYELCLAEHMDWSPAVCERWLTILVELFQTRSMSQSRQLGQLCVQNLDDVQFGSWSFFCHRGSFDKAWWYPNRSEVSTVAHLYDIATLDYLFGPNHNGNDSRFYPREYRPSLQSVLWLPLVNACDSGVVFPCRRGYTVLFEYIRREIVYRVTDTRADGFKNISTYVADTMAQLYEKLLESMLFLGEPGSTVVTRIQEFSTDFARTCQEQQRDEKLAVDWMSDENCLTTVLASRYHERLKSGVYQCMVSAFVHYPVFRTWRQSNERWRRISAGTKLDDSSVEHKVSACQENVLLAILKSISGRRTYNDISPIAMQQAKQLPSLMAAYVLHMPVNVVFVTAIFESRLAELVRWYCVSDERRPLLREFFADAANVYTVCDIFGIGIAEHLVLRNVRVLRELDIVSRETVLGWLEDLVVRGYCGRPAAVDNKIVKVSLSLLYAYVTSTQLRRWLQRITHNHHDRIYSACYYLERVERDKAASGKGLRKASKRSSNSSDSSSDSDKLSSAHARKRVGIGR